MLYVKTDLVLEGLIISCKYPKTLATVKCHLQIMAIVISVILFVLSNYFVTVQKDPSLRSKVKVFLVPFPITSSPWLSVHSDMKLSLSSPAATRLAHCHLRRPMSILFLLPPFRHHSIPLTSRYCISQADLY